MSGDSRFYYAPMYADGAMPVGVDADAADLETITVPAGSVICEPDPTGDASIPSSGTGKTYAVADTRGMTVRIRCALGNDSDLAESFMAMVSHAKEGGVIGFALDTDFVWAVQLVDDILRGDSDFDYPPSLVEVWEGITDPEVGWKCHAQSPLPQGRRETIKLDGVAAGNATLDGSFVFALATQGQNVLVRHKFFFPFLRYLSGDVLLSEPTGGVYVFDCVFEVDVGLEHIPVVTEVDYLLLWDFETAGEGYGGTTFFVNQGTYATTASIGNQPTRVTDQFYEGVASCNLESISSSFFIDLGGDTDLDVDGDEGVTIEFAFRPNGLSGARYIFEWGTNVSDRFGFFLDSGEAKVNSVHSSATTVLTTGFTVTDLAWSVWKLHLIPNGTSELFIDGVSKGTASLAGAFTVAAFGNNMRWGRLSVVNSNYCGGWIDSFTWRAGIH